SSRRRHTRSTRDWSSDVCSSDLALLPQDGRAVHREAARGDERLAVVLLQLLVEGEGEQVLDVAPPLPHAAHALRQHEPARRRDRSEERRVGKEGKSRWAPRAEEG